MKKLGIFLVLLSYIIIITGCKTTTSENKTDNEKMFVTVEYSHGEYSVVYNRYTKVMYVVSYTNGTFTLLVNSDGSPMLYDEEVEE